MSAAVGYLGSGSGTTIRESLREIDNGILKGVVRPALVITNRAGAGVRQVARDGKMREEDILYMPLSRYGSDEARGEAIIEECRKRGVEIVVQYGWMPKTPLNVIRAFAGYIHNQHPASLDPGYLDFGGEGMHGLAAIAAQWRFAQLTDWENPMIEPCVHHVVEKVDGGDLVQAEWVPMLEGENPVLLQKRLLPFEWSLQTAALRAIALGRATRIRRTSRLVQSGQEGLLATAKAWGTAYAAANENERDHMLQAA